MNNNYEFKNEYYKNLVTNMKLTIFDIIASEEAKLSKVLDILNSQPEGTDISMGVDLYNSQKNCITNMTLLANDLSSIFSQFDYNTAVIDDVFTFSDGNEVTQEQQVSENDTPQEDYGQEVNNDDYVAPTETDIPYEEGTTNEEAVAIDEAAPDADEAVESQEIVAASDEIVPVADEAVESQEIVAAPEEVAPVVEPDNSNEESTVVETIPEAKEEMMVIPADSLDDEPVVDSPIASLTEEKVDDTTSDEKIDFIAIDPEFSRAILVTKKQTKNLRDSLLSKTLEFNNFVIKNKNVSDEELIDKGLLEPDDSIEAKIEKMMEDANNLYKEGKTDEAQALYEEISKLNSQLKETTVSK